MTLKYYGKASPKETPVKLLRAELWANSCSQVATLTQVLAFRLQHRRGRLWTWVQKYSKPQLGPMAPWLYGPLTPPIRTLLEVQFEIKVCTVVTQKEYDLDLVQSLQVDSLRIWTLPSSSIYSNSSILEIELGQRASDKQFDQDTVAAGGNNTTILGVALAVEQQQLSSPIQIASF